MTALQPAKRYEWERIVRRCVLPRQVKLVAFLLAQYGDMKGEDIRPGVPRLAAVAGMGESTVRRHLDELRRLGLIECVAHGGGRNQLAARYRLTVPEDLLERVQMLDPDERTPLATVSAVRAGNSAHSDERSEGSYSAHSGTVLRSFPDPTALISGPYSAHPGERLPTDQGDHTREHQDPSSPNATSPAAPADTTPGQGPHGLTGTHDQPARPVPAPPGWRTR